MLRFTAPAVILALFPVSLFAQTSRDAVLNLAGASVDLKFPSEAAELSVFSRPQMAIYKPKGDGPFPALVILPACGGLRAEILEWAKRAVERGYVAFVVDPVTQRGRSTRAHPDERGGSRSAGRGLRVVVKGSRNKWPAGRVACIQ
jgi:hypothetical protein